MVRKSSDVARIVGREQFLDEFERRGFQAIENCAGKSLLSATRIQFGFYAESLF